MRNTFRISGVLVRFKILNAGKNQYNFADYVQFDISLINSENVKKSRPIIEVVLFWRTFTILIKEKISMHWKVI